MTRYLFRRLRYSVLVLWGVVTLVFFLFHVLPADPARLTMGQRSDLKSIENARKALHLDKPVAYRYLLFLNDLSPVGILSAQAKSEGAKGFTLIPLGKERTLSLKYPNLGRSYRSNRLVTEILWAVLPNTAVLALSALAFATFFGILLGVLAAVKKGSWLDTSSLVASIAGISMPSFFAGLIIAYVFGFLLHSYTGLDMTGSLWEYDAFGGKTLALRHLILPALALGIRPLAIITQLTRSAMLDVLEQDYIRTARAKGLSKGAVVFRHALPNALNPVITAISSWLAELLAGSFFIEFIFGWNGIGRITVEALDKFDFPLVMGSVLLSAFIFIVVNLLTDLVYARLDPRVRL